MGGLMVVDECWVADYISPAAQKVRFSEEKTEVTAARLKTAW